jgi:hypothetical protein
VETKHRLGVVQHIEPGSTPHRSLNQVEQLNQGSGQAIAATDTLGE